MESSVHFDPAFVYSVEVLPRLKSAQVDILTDYHMLSLTNECFLTKEVSSLTGDAITKHSFGKLCELDLDSYSPIKLNNGILNVKFKTLSKPGTIAAPSDLLGSSVTSMLRLSCCFCSAIITKKEM